MEKMDERLKKQMNFLLEVDKLKFISRQTYLSDGNLTENVKKMMENTPGIWRLWQCCCQSIPMKK